MRALKHEYNNRKVYHYNNQKGTTIRPHTDLTDLNRLASITEEDLTDSIFQEKIWKYEKKYLSLLRLKIIV